LHASILSHSPFGFFPAAIPQAVAAFQSDGSLEDPKRQEWIRNLGAQLAQFLARLHGKGFGDRS
jgi:hypothetical protein